MHRSMAAADAGPRPELKLTFTLHLQRMKLVVLRPRVVNCVLL